MPLFIIVAALLSASPPAPAPRLPFTVQLQPGTVKPGDVVLVTVSGADDQPHGTLGGHTLNFLEMGDAWVALLGLSIETKPGTLALSVSVPEEKTSHIVLGTLEVLAPNFPSRTLTVDRRFTNPSKKDQAWAAADQRAFTEAFSVELEPLRFQGNFQLPRFDCQGAPYGDRRLFNGQQKSQHYGNDIDGELGDPIYASNDGEVVMVRPCFGSGNTVLVHHGAKLFSAYFHMSKFLVKPGDAVSKGQVLGLVGATGRVTGPHLHFGMKLDGRWVNPMSVLGLDFTTTTELPDDVQQGADAGQ